MKTVILILCLIAGNATAKEPSIHDAHNKDEAFGMMYTLIMKFKVYVFMCDKYHPDLSNSFADSIDLWNERHEKSLSNYASYFEEVPKKEMDELVALNKKVYERRIIQFNRMSSEEQKAMCNKQIKDLRDNIYESEIPNMFKLLRGE
ncbi:hypothetical protein [Aliikangiella coralliicola]|uniref:DUF5106 domain-containing protein n=1 Tax=Aliikangiella coralliicola TaxID=2592383 RepID=A0A545UFP4_9GAMM|nr:hypothetical protein [Aliikangiella coralliicola]TQV88287.1 hypothetical protein FLL46_07095 [Aliikangiella coralliicola]